MSTRQFIDKPLTDYSDKELSEALEKTKAKLEALKHEAVRRLRFRHDV